MNSFAAEVPKKGAVAAFMAKHVAEQKVLTIQPDPNQIQGDENQPSIQTTKTHFVMLIPKNIAWMLLLGTAVGGPSLMTYVANRAGLVTREEMTKCVTEAVVASQKATQESLNRLIEESVRNAVESAVKPIDERVARIERAAKASKSTRETTP